MANNRIIVGKSDKLSSIFAEIRGNNLPLNAKDDGEMVTKKRYVPNTISSVSPEIKELLPIELRAIIGKGLAKQYVDMISSIKTVRDWKELCVREQRNHMLFRRECILFRQYLTKMDYKVRRDRLIVDIKCFETTFPKMNAYQQEIYDQMNASLYVLRQMIVAKCGDDDAKKAERKAMEELRNNGVIKPEVVDVIDAAVKVSTNMIHRLRDVGSSISDIEFDKNIMQYAPIPISEFHKISQKKKTDDRLNKAVFAMNEKNFKQYLKTYQSDDRLNVYDDVLNTMCKHMMSSKHDKKVLNILQESYELIKDKENGIIDDMIKFDGFENERKLIKRELKKDDENHSWVKKKKKKKGDDKMSKQKDSRSNRSNDFDGLNRFTEEPKKKKNGFQKLKKKVIKKLSKFGKWIKGIFKSISRIVIPAMEDYMEETMVNKVNDVTKKRNKKSKKKKKKGNNGKKKNYDKINKKNKGKGKKVKNNNIGSKVKVIKLD